MGCPNINMKLYIILVFFQITNSSIPKEYLDSLLSNYFFKGYDLVISVGRDSEENILSWLKEGNNSQYSLLTKHSNLFETLQQVRTNSKSLEQIAVLVEFRNISLLQEQIQLAKSYSRITSVPQPYFFVIVPDAPSYEDLCRNEEALKNVSLQFSINSDFYLFGAINSEGESSASSNDIPRNYGGYPLPTGFGLTELYSLKNITFIQEVNLTMHNILQKVSRRQNFRKAKITAVAQLGFSQIKFSPDMSKFDAGFEADQLDFLASSYNFTVVPLQGKGWISIDDRGELTGMAKQLISREADISISASEMLLYRAEKLTFLHPTYYTTIWGFFKPPASNSLRDIFINAFTLDLWLTMFATWFLIIMAMIALAIVKWRLGTLHENDKIVVQEVVIWACGAMCQQGWHVCPESGCMKIVFIFALITGLVSYVGYSAALVSILSVKVVPIQSLDDLVGNRYTIYTDNGTTSASYIAKDLEAIIKLLPKKDREVDVFDGVNKVLTTQSAFLGVSDVFYQVAKDALGTDLKVCKSIQRVSISKHRPVKGGMFVRKRSSFADFFNIRVLVLYERGIRYRLLESFFRESSVSCLDLNASEKEPLGLNDVITAYIILLIGYLTSITLLVLEKMCATTLVTKENKDINGTGYNHDLDVYVHTKN